MNYTLMPGQSHAASEEETLSMIRSVLTEEVEQPPKRKRSPKARQPKADRPDTPQATATPRPFVERTTESNPRRRATDLPDLADTDASGRKRGAPKVVQNVAGLVSRLRAFRPTTRHLAIVSVLLLLVVRPHWFVIGTVLGVALVVGVFMVLGADRIWGGVVKRLDQVEARDPVRACELRKKLDRFACRWDAILDFFPDGMVDGLYMPDLQSLHDAEQAHENAVADRLNRMVQEG